MGVKRALVFMNWQQRLKDMKFKLEARSLKVCDMLCVCLCGGGVQMFAWGMGRCVLCWLSCLRCEVW